MMRGDSNDAIMVRARGLTCVRVTRLGLLGHDGERPGYVPLVPQPLEVPDLPAQVLMTLVEVRPGDHPTPLPHDHDGVRAQLRPDVGRQPLLPLADPRAEVRAAVELREELVARPPEGPSLELLPPLLPEDVSHPPHEGVDLPLHLPGPEDLPRHGRHAPGRREVGGARRLVPVRELGLEAGHGLTDRLHELELEFLYGRADAGPAQQGTEAGEDPEHVLGVLVGRRTR